MPAIRSSMARTPTSRRSTRPSPPRRKKGADDATPPPDDAGPGIDQIWTYDQSFAALSPEPAQPSRSRRPSTSSPAAPMDRAALTATLVDLRTGRSVPPADVFAPARRLEAHHHRHRPAPISSGNSWNGRASRSRSSPPPSTRCMNDPERYLFKADRARDHLQPVRRRRLCRRAATPSTFPTAASRLIRPTARSAADQPPRLRSASLSAACAGPAHGAAPRRRRRRGARPEAPGRNGGRRCASRRPGARSCWSP